MALQYLVGGSILRVISAALSLLCLEKSSRMLTTTYGINSEQERKGLRKVLKRALDRVSRTLGLGLGRQTSE